MERYLKGSGEKTISIAQYQGMLVPRGTPVTASMIEKAREENNHIHLIPGDRFLMFLDQSQTKYEGFSRGTIFFGVGHPWLFDITDPECVRPIDFPEGISRYFPPQPLTAVIEQINQPFDPSKQTETLSPPYPPPEVFDRCPE